MMQPELFNWIPPTILGDRDGLTFDRKRDGKRLSDQATDVYRLMRDGEWRTLAAISAVTGHPEASVSARLRDFKKRQFGSYQVEKRYVSSGLWEYRLGGQR